jgi:hypothetical protein
MYAKQLRVSSLQTYCPGVNQQGKTEVAAQVSTTAIGGWIAKLPRVGSVSSPDQAAHIRRYNDSKVSTQADCWRSYKFSPMTAVADFFRIDYPARVGRSGCLAQPATENFPGRRCRHFDPAVMAVSFEPDAGSGDDSGEA